MASILDDLKDAIKALEGSVKKDLQEIQRQRSAVQQIADGINETVVKGKVIRDDNRIILSAPEVIIGNVDLNGDLLNANGGSTVVIRGGNVSMEGVGSAGTITQRASSIRSLAVDPGVDGSMALVYGSSEIVSQARNITLQSNEEIGCFVNSAVGMNGVNILADTNVKIHATPSAKSKKKDVENSIKSLGKAASKLESAASDAKTRMDKLIKDIEKLVKDQEKYNGDDEDVCMDYDRIDEMHHQFEILEAELVNVVSTYVHNLSMQAENNRRQTALKAIKDDLGKKESNFEKKGINTGVSIQAEAVTMTSTDGEGNLRETPNAGLFVQMPHITLGAHDKKGEVMKDSFLNVNVHDITMSTANTKLDDKGENGDITCDGSFILRSKQVSVFATDGKISSKKAEEKALTKDGSFKVRVENVDFSNTDTEGKSTGTINLNAKDIKIAAYDVDKEKRTDKEMAKGSQMQLLTEKVFVGSNKEKKAVELVQVAGKSVGIMGKETAEIQEGEAKSVVTLNGGNVTAGGSKVELKGNTTIEGNADIKGEAKAPKVTADQVDVKSAFKSPNINDTMGAGMPGQAGKPSAKLKEEEAAAAKGGSK